MSRHGPRHDAWPTSRWGRVTAPRRRCVRPSARVRPAGRRSSSTSPSRPVRWRARRCSSDSCRATSCLWSGQRVYERGGLGQDGLHLAPGAVLLIAPVLALPVGVRLKRREAPAPRALGLGARRPGHGRGAGRGAGGPPRTCPSRCPRTRRSRTSSPDDAASQPLRLNAPSAESEPPHEATLQRHQPLPAAGTSRPPLATDGPPDKVLRARRSTRSRAAAGRSSDTPQQASPARRKADLPCGVAGLVRRHHRPASWLVTKT